MLSLFRRTFHVMQGQAWLYLAFVVALSFFTYFYRYDQPKAVYWDENYHISAAQKYLNGVYFMEPHPPLGKLLIAAGEALFDANPGKDDNFIGTDYGRDFPAGFSFVGYRFFPALMAWLTAPLFFFIFLLITRNPLQSTFLSFLYIFDTALIVHLRGAMLESALLFFSTSMTLAFLLLLEYRSNKRVFFWSALLFGVSFACIMTTKILGLIFILMIPYVLWRLWPDKQRILQFIGVAGWSFLLVYCAVWYIHIANGKTIHPSLPDQGYYQASSQHKQILDNHGTSALGAFPLLLRDHLQFVHHYESGAPRLDLCKVDENGSPWFMWPFGGRTINYRWETPNGSAHRYLYLVPNPVVWFAGLIAVLLAIALFVVRGIATVQESVQQKSLFLFFLALYV
jgi:dolichyl-phosphate-mannose--protein O-mannosyl transferase